MAYQRNYSVKSGAQKGLEVKMNYWSDKDYNYEFGVSIGASIGWAIQRLMGLKEIDDALVDETIKYWFKKGLEMKSDPEMRAIFDEYYLNKNKRPEKTTKKVENGIPTISLDGSVEKNVVKKDDFQ